MATKGADIVYLLFNEVCTDPRRLEDARKALRAHVAQLSPEDAVEWRQGARAKAQKMMQVAEAFLQELTVLGAGQ